MERQPFVAVTCQACSFQRAWGGSVRVCLGLSQCIQALLFLVVFLGFNICLALISGAVGAGMRGMQALGLPVYSEGFLQCCPPLHLPLPSFLSRIFHIFALAVVLGTGHRPGTQEPPVAFLNSFLQHT